MIPAASRERQSTSTSQTQSEVPETPAFSSAYTQDRTEPENGDKIELLKRALLNERAAPEMLHHQTALIHEIRVKVRLQESIAAGFEAQQDESELLGHIYRQEVLRIQYLLKAYYRCRLAKIEKFSAFLLNTKDEEKKLNKSENEYLEGYFRLTCKLLKESFLMDLPEHLGHTTRQSVFGGEDSDMIVKPNLDTHVFCKALSDLGNLAMDDEGREQMRFDEGDLFIVRYRTIRALLAEGRVCLL